MSVGLLVPAADAVTSPVVSYKGLPTNWWGLSLPCSPSGTPSSYSGTHTTGPGTPPAQQGSLRVSDSSGTMDVLGVDFGYTPVLSGLTAFTGSVYVAGGSTDNVQFEIDASDGSTTDYSLTLATPTRDAWVSLDLLNGATLNWQSYDHNTGNPVASGTTTWSAFTTAHSNLVLEDLAFAPLSGCSPVTYYLDDVHYAVGAIDDTVDFEAPYADSFVNHTSSRSVLTGTPVTLSATLSSTAQPFSTGQTVQLWAKSATSSTYKLLKTLTTDPTTGAVSYRVGPSSSTSYQWRYPASNAGNNYAPVNSSVTTIVTRQRVAITSKPTTTSYRGYATIKGRLTPAKSGVVVRLVREVSGRRIVVASARSTTGGYFTLKAPMLARGTYTYVVTASAYTGEAAGQSASFRITTR